MAWFVTGYLLLMLKGGSRTIAKAPPNFGGAFAMVINLVKNLN